MVLQIHGKGVVKLLVVECSGDLELRATAKWEGDLAGGTLQELVGDDMSTVSKHLLVLKNAGLVASRREGNWLHYSLTCPCVLEFAECIKGVI